MCTIVYVEEIPIKVRFRGDFAILSVYGYVFSRVSCYNLDYEEIRSEFNNHKERVLEILENQLDYKIESLSLIKNTIQNLNTLEKIKVLKGVL